MVPEKKILDQKKVGDRLAEKSKKNLEIQNSIFEYKYFIREYSMHIPNKSSLSLEHYL